MGPQNQAGANEGAADEQPGYFGRRLTGNPWRQDRRKGRIKIKKYHCQ